MIREELFSTWPRPWRLSQEHTVVVRDADGHEVPDDVVIALAEALVEFINARSDEPDIEHTIEIVAAWRTSDEGPSSDRPDMIDDFIRLARKLRTRDRRDAVRAVTEKPPIVYDEGNLDEFQDP